MGPFYKKDATIPSWDGFPFFDIWQKIQLKLLMLVNKGNKTINQYFYFFVQPDGTMETGSGSFLSPEEAARLGNEAAAAAAAVVAAAAAAAAAASAAGIPSLPANSGSVQTANPPIPPSEHSKLIRITRELRYKPTVLGGGDALLLWNRLRTFTLWVMGGWVGLS
jgi:hypothetical protein